MQPQQLSPVLSQVHEEDAKLRSILSSLVSDFRSKASLDSKEHNRRLESVVSQLSRLLAKRNDLTSLVQSMPPSPQLTDVASQLQSTAQSCTRYMHELDTGARSLLSTIDACTQGLSAHKHTPNPHDVLSLAHRLRYTSFDSLGVLPSQPPAPQMWHMRGSALAAFNSQHAAAAAQTHMTADSSEPSSSVPAIPLQLYGHLPPKPEGWKEGDRVVLPGFESGSSSGEDDMEVDGEGEGLDAGGDDGGMGLAWALNPELGWEPVEEPVSDEYSDEEDDDD